MNRIKNILFTAYKDGESKQYQAMGRNAQTLYYLAMAGSNGITCATFVLSIFHTLGYQLLQLETWKPTIDDKAWQFQILNSIASNFGLISAHAVGKNIGATRYKPEYVAAGTISQNKPISFQEAEKIAAEIKDCLTNAKKAF